MSEVNELLTAIEGYGFECTGGELKNAALWTRLKYAVEEAAKVTDQSEKIVEAKVHELAEAREKISLYRGACHKGGTLLETSIHRLRRTAKMLQGTQSVCSEVASDLEDLRRSLLQV